MLFSGNRFLLSAWLQSGELQAKMEAKLTKNTKEEEPMLKSGRD